MRPESTGKIRYIEKFKEGTSGGLRSLEFKWRCGIDSGEARGARRVLRILHLTLFALLCIFHSQFRILVLKPKEKK